MNDVTKSTARKPDVPEEIRARWQRILDLSATILDVTAAAIMKADSPEVEVFLSSAGEGNPFRKGERSKLEAGLYCERVINKRTPLLIPDALKDPEWKQSPMIRLGMTYYLGFPLLWSDGEIFGSICIFDRKDNPQATRFQQLVEQFRQLMEKDLCTLVEIGEREDLLADLQRHRDHLREMVAEQTAELEKSKKALEERLRFENLVSDLSASFVNVPPDRVEDEIARALNEICRFFKADHCGLLEALVDLGQARFVNMTDKEERQKEGLSFDLVSDRPWAHHRLLELEEPVIFSSLEDLPPEASVDRAAFEKEGTQALLVLPLRVGGKVTHLIGLRSFCSGHEWPAAYVRRLQVLGNVLANALIQKRAQEALLKGERVLNEAQRIAHLGSWDWNIVGGDLHWSDEVYRIFGLLPQQFGATYEAFLALVHPDDRQAVEQAVNESLSDPDKTYSFEHRVVCPDGAQRFVHERAEVFFDQNRRPIRMVGTVHDITERKRADDENRALMMSVQEEKERLSALINSIADEVWFADTQERFSLANPTALREFGLATGSQVDVAKLTSSLEVLRPDGSLRPHKEAPPLRALTGEIVKNQEEIVRTPATGELRHRQVSAAPVRDSKGEIIGSVSVVRDITELIHKEKELERAFDEIKRLKEQLEAENIYLREEVDLKDGFKDIIGISNTIKYVMRKIQQVAPTSTTVLLTGETGTGKGLFARSLHQASGRRDKPFVKVNCAGLPPNLIESELFGREKGAFTGSTARQIGRFELANGGTIFLDEIGELPLELQAKLLKVIEDGEFERLGSPRPVKVDVRIIASTNRDLEEEIKNGHFRKDLFYRLNVFPVTIPSLRQRREDIPLLVKFYIDKLSKSHGKDIEKISKNTMKALEDYPWPGNVRELINVIERAVIVSDGPELRLAEKIDAMPIGSPQDKESMNERETKGLVEIEREHILRTLQETQWRIEGSKGAAQRLKMNPSTLKGRMRKLGIKRPRSY